MNDQLAKENREREEKRGYHTWPKRNSGTGVENGLANGHVNGVGTWATSHSTQVETKTLEKPD